MYQHKGYKFQVRKSKETGKNDQPLWDLIVTTPAKEKKVYVGVLGYSNGWDQGQASERAKDGSSYYLRTIPTGFSSGNGQGISSQRTPYLYESRLDSIIEAFQENSTRGEWNLYLEENV